MITADQPGNLRRLLDWRWALGTYAVAVASGLLLSAAFPPLELAGLAWCAIVPLLLLPASPRRWRRARIGWCFGFTHFLTCLFWLTEVTVAGWIALSAVCALFLGAWYLAAAAMLGPSGQPSGESDARRRKRGWRGQLPAVVLLPAFWVAGEWVRSWLFTGFPWNQLGVSQWESRMLIQSASVTGVYGISFLVVAANVALAQFCRRNWRCFRRGQRRQPSWDLMLLLVLLLASVGLALRQTRPGNPDRYLRVTAVQGCIPQCRAWTQEQFEEALDVYVRLTREMTPAAQPHLVVWPETAVPAAARWDEQYVEALRGLFPDLDCMLLIGSIDYRMPPQADPGTEPLAFNSALLFDADGSIRDFYDKIHLVPVGEYTPLEALWPWVTDLIGMGRSLIAGTEFTVLELPQDTQAGVCICYEDVFPAISRGFVRRGANLLMTLTNDAWYAESPGSRQHMVHAVFRAVENRRPLFRAGNNSDTCLILPDGRVTGLLYDRVTGNRFVRGAKTYEVPVWDELGYTFYTRHGDAFAHVCTLLTAGALVITLSRWLTWKKTLWDKITGASARSA